MAKYMAMFSGYVMAVMFLLLIAGCSPISEAERSLKHEEDRAAHDAYLQTVYGN